MANSEIQISILLQKPDDLDQHVCKGRSRVRRTRVKPALQFVCYFCLNLLTSVVLLKSV